MSDFSEVHFHDEEAAFVFYESLRWPDGPACPRCGDKHRITKVKANPEKRVRLGLWRCGCCKRQFTVKIGTPFEHARLPLHKLLRAIYLVTSTTKAPSADKLHRAIGVSYKTAWLLSRRIRNATWNGNVPPFTFGGPQPNIVEALLSTSIDPSVLHWFR